MGHRQHLEARIRELYSFICEHQKIMQMSNRPEEKLSSEQAVEKHWVRIEHYLREYVSLCRYQHSDLSNDGSLGLRGVIRWLARLVHYILDKAIIATY